MVPRSARRLIAAAIFSFALLPGASAQENGAILERQERLGELLSALRQLKYAEEFPLLSLRNDGLDALHGEMLLRGMVAHLHDETLMLRRLQAEADAFAETELAKELFGILARPVHAPLLGDFGESDGTGGKIQGLVLKTAPGASIVMPVDGEIVFSAPFQNYGRLLIIEAGEGYHLVLAGLERLSAEVGEWLARGEPVGVMGLSREVTFAADSDSSLPQLYMEFRRRGEAVAPKQWVEERDKWKNG